VNVRPRFDVHGDDVGAGPGEGFEIGVGGCNHQMHVERLFGVRTDRANDIGANGNIRDKMAVHDVDMDPVGAGGIDGAHLLAEFCEIGG
jgi:hypothetical protein